MRREMPFESDKLDYFSFRNFLENDNTENPKIKRMKHIVKVAIENELTDRQKDCITMKYFENMKVKDIAVRMDIKPTTVYKHLKTAMRVFKKCAMYL